MVMCTLTLLCTLVAKSELPEVRAHHVHKVKQTSVIQQQQGIYKVMDCNSCYDNNDQLFKYVHDFIHYTC